MVSLSQNIKVITGWSENANLHIKNITSQLSEIENLLDKSLPENDINLLEILELIDYIQEQHKSIIKNITSEKPPLDEMNNDLQNQLKILNQTFKLLKIEAGNTVS